MSETSGVRARTDLFCASTRQVVWANSFMPCDFGTCTLFVDEDRSRLIDVVPTVVGEARRTLTLPCSSAQELTKKANWACVGLYLRAVDRQQT